MVLSVLDIIWSGCESFYVLRWTKTREGGSSVWKKKKTKLALKKNAQTHGNAMNLTNQPIPDHNYATFQISFQKQTKHIEDFDEANVYYCFCIYVCTARHIVHTPNAIRPPNSRKTHIRRRTRISWYPTQPNSSRTKKYVAHARTSGAGGGAGSWTTGNAAASLLLKTADVSNAVTPALYTAPPLPAAKLLTIVDFLVKVVVLPSSV